MSTRELTVTAPPPLPGLPDESIGRDVNRVFDLIREEGGVATLPALPGPALRRRLEARAADLATITAPCGQLDARRWRDDRSAQHIAGMFTGFSANRGRDTNWDELVIAYRIHLQDLPAFAIEAACTDVSRRKVRDLDPDYIPSSARLHEVAEKHAGPRWTEQHRIGKILAVTRAAPPPPTEEQAREMRGKLAGLAAALCEPLVEERREHEKPTLRAIADQGTRAILREYERLGVEPVYNGEFLVSPSLAAKVGALPAKALRRPRDRE